MSRRRAKISIRQKLNVQEESKHRITNVESQLGHLTFLYVSDAV
jgi:hypothetical protein